MKIIAFSDTHGQHEKLKIPECDVLVFAGDWSHFTNPESSISFSDWLIKQPATYKVIIPGNHDQYSYLMDDSLIILENRVAVIEGKTFLGSPYTREFCGWYYMKSEEELEDMYEGFPRSGIDVLITHGPPLGILDNYKPNRLGSPALLNYISCTRPKVHIFGHIHNMGKAEYTGTNFYNVAILDHDYLKQQEPVEIII